MDSKQVYLSLGGNVGPVLFRLQQALSLLSFQKEVVTSLKISHFYLTAPVEVKSSNWFVNAVCSFWTQVSPAELFMLTQTIETQLGKQTKPKNADRPIDIDLLFYGNESFRDHSLTIPHPRWKERLFVLVPLADLTQEIYLQHEEKSECYHLRELIERLMKNNNQAIFRHSLFEVNSQKSLSSVTYESYAESTH